MGLGGQRRVRTALTQWMTPYTLHRMLGRPQTQSGRVTDKTETKEKLGFCDKSATITQNLSTLSAALRFVLGKCSCFLHISQVPLPICIVQKVYVLFQVSRTIDWYCQAFRHTDKRNVTLRRVLVSVVAVEKRYTWNIVKLCLYSCPRYLACKSHLFCVYYVLILTIFSHLIS